VSKITDNLLKYLINDRIIDKNSADEISKKVENSKDIIGDILVKNGFFAKEDLLLLNIEYYKKGYLTLGQINNNFAIDIVYFLKELAKNLKLKYVDLDSVDIDYRMLAKLPFAQLKKFGALPINEEKVWCSSYQ